MSNKKILFLLGGYDLEMVEIKNILDKYNFKYLDKKLSWGARLSDYSNHFDEMKLYDIVYGIELIEDIPLPNNYKSIDHHNENDSNPSSVQQVANILNIKLTKEQQLISANDSRYIKGMQSLNASKDEIENIRKRDREFQGVTKEDEKLALKSIENSSSKSIYSYTKHFSAVSDIAYFKYQNYIIYNDSKIVFYGFCKKQILDFLEKQNIEKSSIYHGGGDFGFIGIVENVLSKKEIEQLIKEFEKVNMDETIYSYHTFMFPFVFEKSESKEIDKTIWIEKDFKVNNQRDYNEKVYFYKHVQNALFSNESNKDNYISKYYEYKDGDSGIYTIECKKGIFELDLDGLSLRVFNTNIGILSFNLKNTRYQYPEQILAINDFGRRTYPQFLGNNLTCDTKSSILAQSIKLNINNKIISDNFTKFDTHYKDKNINLLPEYISTLINSSFKNIEPIIDDRMFTLSFYMNSEIMNFLKKYNEHRNEYNFENDDYWYKYLFIDGDYKTCTSKKMTKKLIQESTYDRWIEEGTLFGISRYSFVILAKNEWFPQNIILPHMQTMYFQIFTLICAYKASIIKFSRDIQTTTQTNENEISDEMEKLYKRYLDFINKLYFKEVTAQDQGIELYNQAIKILDINNSLKDLDNEMKELYKYVQLIEEKKSSEKMDSITELGAIFLPASLVSGILGMNVLPPKIGEYELGSLTSSIIFIIVIIFITLLTAKIFKINVKNFMKKTWFATKEIFNDVIKFKCKKEERSE